MSSYPTVNRESSCLDVETLPFHPTCTPLATPHRQHRLLLLPHHPHVLRFPIKHGSKWTSPHSTPPIISPSSAGGKLRYSAGQRHHGRFNGRKTWRSVWNPSEKVVHDVTSMLKGVDGILKEGGKMIYITFGQPHFRKKYLEAVEGWEVETRTLGDMFHYFVYIATKKPRTTSTEDLTTTEESTAAAESHKEA